MSNQNLRHSFNLFIMRKILPLFNYYGKSSTSSSPQQISHEKKMQTKRLPNVHKILIIRNDAIGDMILSTPAIALLRKNYPSAEISVLARTLNAGILAGNPDVDRVLIFDRKKTSRADRLRFYKELRHENFDLAIAIKINSSSRHHFLAWISGAKYRLGYKRRCLISKMTHEPDKNYQKGSVHFVERSNDLLGMICDGEIEPRLVLNLSDKEICQAKKRLENWGIAQSDLLVGIHPGGRTFCKRWNEDDFAEIADRIVAEYNGKILIFRGPGEEEIEQNVLKNVKSSVISYAPQSIRELATLIFCCKLFICNDSGPMHIAAALDVLTVAIFGPTDHVTWGPLNDRSTVVRRDMPCWPCSPTLCRLGWECVKKLPVEMVWKAVKRVRFAS